MKPIRIAGFDVGTSGVKITLVDAANGAIRENYRFDYTNFRQLRPGVVPVSVYVEAVENALDALQKDFSIASLAICTQMYSVCAWENGELVVVQWNSLWNRKREIEDRLAAVSDTSGCPVDTLFPAYKLLSLREDERLRFVPYGVKEALMERLTGNRVVDLSTASATGLFDIREKKWNTALIKDLGLDLSQLAQPIFHDQQVGKYGETVIAPGLGDGPSASLACLTLSPFCGNVGTSMAARLFTSRPTLGRGLWNVAVDMEAYVVGGISSNACSVLNWARREGLVLPPTLPPGGDIRFFPWLHGERMPYWSSDLRGTFTGLRINDSKEDVAVAVVKSVAFTFVRMAEALEGYVPKDKPLVLAGGGAHVAGLTEVVAGCLHTPIMLLDGAEYLCSTGAAISAGQAIGVPVSHDLKTTNPLLPDGKYRAEYESWLEMAQRATALYREALS